MIVNLRETPWQIDVFRNVAFPDVVQAEAAKIVKKNGGEICFTYDVKARLVTEPHVIRHFVDNGLEILCSPEFAGHEIASPVGPYWHRIQIPRVLFDRAKSWLDAHPGQVTRESAREEVKPLRGNVPDVLRSAALFSILRLRGSL